MSTFNILKKIYPINTSIAGKGNRKKLSIISKEIPIKIHNYKSGTKCYDWIIPKEWEIKEAYIKSIKSNRKLLDLNDNCMHVINYSYSINKVLNLKELKKNLYTNKKLPNSIPYITSYYKKNWGFCLEYNKLKKLKNENYKVYINSTHKKGYLNCGEAYIKGKSKSEILISTYICHPFQANDGNSGIAVAIQLYKFLKANKNNYYSYRFLFLPETIGAIAYLFHNEKKLKKNIKAGFVITCVGDKGKFNYKQTKNGNIFIDKISKNVLKFSKFKYNIIPFFPEGSDERQYSSPGFNFMIASIMRTPYGNYEEYHTSKDDLTFVKNKYLIESLHIYKKVIMALEGNSIFKRYQPHCEIMLSKYGLYQDISNLSNQENDENKKIMLFLLNNIDGNHSLIDIAEKMDKNIFSLIEVASQLKNKKIIYECKRTENIII